MHCDEVTEGREAGHGEDSTTLAANRAGSGVGEASQPSAGHDPNAGRRIGPYRIERLLGRGGMGVVYLAVREDEYEQRVALKLIDSDRLSTDVLARFYNERQILAKLQHPNVARILDGGTTDETLPYFVMEYVEGEPIDRYCEARQLSLRRRLELFRSVCSAVHFAHQNLVVHRDLKPGNILVTAAGTVKLLDFGIAKILGGKAAQRGADTGDGPWPMTPRFASPEQISGQEVTTGSDVYSLGVLLCYLVSGHFPYRLSGDGTATLVDAIREAKLMTPSAALLQAEGGGRPGQGARQLAGDVDAIVIKALSKDPRHRYPSALQIAEDIGRHLADKPVEAREGDWKYLAGKFVRRNRLGVLAALLFVGFSASSTVSWQQAVRQRSQAEQARLEAEQARQRSEHVSHFLESLFQSADPDLSRGQPMSVREALDRGRERLAGQLSEEPEVRADLLLTLGTVYNNLGHYPEARELKEESLRVRRAADPRDRPQLAANLNNLARLYYDLADYAGAESMFREALEMWQRLGETSEVATMRNLASALMQQGKYGEAKGLLGRVLGIHRELFGPDDPRLAESLYSLGTFHRLRGEPAEAEPLLRQALSIYSRLPDPRYTRVAAISSSLAKTLHARGQLQEARGFYERALELRRQLLGDDHIDVANSEKNLALLLLDLGETDAAGGLLESALATLRRSKPAGEWMIAEAESVWGAYLAALGRLSEAESYLTESYRILRERRGEEYVGTQEAARRLADLSGRQSPARRP